MQSTRYSCRILKKLEFSRRIFENILKYQNSRISVKTEPSHFMRTDTQTDGWTDKQAGRHDESNSRFTQFCENT